MKQCLIRFPGDPGHKARKSSKFFLLNDVQHLLPGNLCIGYKDIRHSPLRSRLFNGRFQILEQIRIGDHVKHRRIIRKAFDLFPCLFTFT